MRNNKASVDDDHALAKFDTVGVKDLKNTKRFQKPKDRAHDIKAALEWMRNRGGSPADDDFVDKLNKVGSVPVSCRSPEEQSEDVDNYVSCWLRNNQQG